MYSYKNIESNFSKKKYFNLFKNTYVNKLLKLKGNKLLFY